MVIVARQWRRKGGRSNGPTSAYCFVGLFEELLQWNVVQVCQVAIGRGCLSLLSAGGGNSHCHQQQELGARREQSPFAGAYFDHDRFRFLSLLLFFFSIKPLAVILVQLCDDSLFTERAAISSQLYDSRTHLKPLFRSPEVSLFA